MNFNPHKSTHVSKACTWVFTTRVDKGYIGVLNYHSKFRIAFWKPDVTSVVLGIWQSYNAVLKLII